MADVLDDEEVRERLPEGWELDEDADAVVRTFEFDDYLEGVAFASEVGELAEEEFHHPIITVRYEAVEVEFRSHEEDGITETDVEMAEKVNELR